MVRLPARRRAGATLRITVGVVLCGGAKPKVGRVAATWIVAPMADEKTFRYLPNRKFVSYAMRPHLLGFREIEVSIG